MRLPALKVSNVPGVPDQRRPSRLQCHDRVVDAGVCPGSVQKVSEV